MRRDLKVLRLTTNLFLPLSFEVDNAAGVGHLLWKSSLHQLARKHRVKSENSATVFCSTKDCTITCSLGSLHLEGFSEVSKLFSIFLRIFKFRAFVSPCPPMVGKLEVTSLSIVTHGQKATKHHCVLPSPKLPVRMRCLI